jgi:hypothetical protein
VSDVAVTGVIGESDSDDVLTGRIEGDMSLQNILANSELTPNLTQSIDTSSPWFDVEEGRYVIDPAERLPPCEKQGLPSSAEDKLEFLSQSSKPLQGHSSQEVVDNCLRSTSAESTPQPPPQPEPRDNGDIGWTDDAMVDLERELGLALEEQAKLSSASASNPRSVVAPRHGIKSRECSQHEEGWVHLERDR